MTRNVKNTDATRTDLYARVTAAIIAQIEVLVRPWMKPWGGEDHRCGHCGTTVGLSRDQRPAVVDDGCGARLCRWPGSNVSKSWASGVEQETVCGP